MSNNDVYWGLTVFVIGGIIGYLSNMAGLSIIIAFILAIVAGTLIGIGRVMDRYND